MPQRIHTPYPGNLQSYGFGPQHLFWQFAQQDPTAALLASVTPQAQLLPQPQFQTKPQDQERGGGGLNEWDEARQAQYHGNRESRYQAGREERGMRIAPPLEQAPGSQWLRDKLDANVPKFFNKDQGINVGGVLTKGMLPVAAEALKFLKAQFGGGQATPSSVPPPPPPPAWGELATSGYEIGGGAPPPPPPAPPASPSNWPTYADTGGGSGSGSYDPGDPAAWGGMPEFQRGGPVPNRGSPSFDPVKATVHEGEFVVRSEVAQRFQPMLELLNSGKIPPAINDMIAALFVDQDGGGSGGGQTSPSGGLSFAAGGMVQSRPNSWFKQRMEGDWTDRLPNIQDPDYQPEMQRWGPDYIPPEYRNYGQEQPQPAGGLGVNVLELLRQMYFPPTGSENQLRTSQLEYDALQYEQRLRELLRKDRQTKYGGPR